MSTFIELYTELHAEVGAAGAAPTQVAAQTGEGKRLVDWIIRADFLIQNKWNTWKFLQTSDSQNTIASDNTLSKPATLKTWDLDTFKLAGEKILAEHYHGVRTENINTTDEGEVSRILILSDLSLQLELTPNAIFAFTADFYKLPIKLAINADVSLIPVQFHDAILGRAMVFYGNHENAPEIKDQGIELFNDYMELLEDDQLPNEDGAARKGSGGLFEVVAE